MFDARVKREVVFYAISQPIDKPDAERTENTKCKLSMEITELHSSHFKNSIRSNITGLTMGKMSKRQLNLFRRKFQIPEVQYELNCLREFAQLAGGCMD